MEIGLYTQLIIRQAVSDSFICPAAFTLWNDPSHVSSNLTFEGSSARITAGQELFCVKDRNSGFLFLF